MKAKSRRRVLVSSVSMLLVSMLALGTATFAWFTTDTTTKANGINLKTTKKSVLLISDNGTKVNNTNKWTDNLNYEFSTTVQPASSNDGANWYHAVATSQTSYKATDGTKCTNSDLANYVFAQQLNVHNAGQKDVKNVTFTFTFNENPAVSGKSYLRYAIVPSTATTPATRSGATIAGDDDDAKAAAFRSAIKSTGTLTYKPVDHVGDNLAAATGTIVEGTEITVGSASGQQVFNVTTGDAVLAKDDGVDGGDDEKYYMIYVWYEGQDENCNDQYAGNELPSFDIIVDGTPVE